VKALRGDGPGTGSHGADASRCLNQPQQFFGSSMKFVRADSFEMLIGFHYVYGRAEAE
jgi:hypothetical protein